MPITEGDRRRFDALQHEAEDAQLAARAAREYVTAAYEAFARGLGTGPTEEELKRANQLEQLAADKALRVKAFLQHLFP